MSVFKPKGQHSYDQVPHIQVEGLDRQQRIARGVSPRVCELHSGPTSRLVREGSGRGDSRQQVSTGLSISLLHKGAGRTFLPSNQVEGPQDPFGELGLSPLRAEGMALTLAWESEGEATAGGLPSCRSPLLVWQSKGYAFLLISQMPAPGTI